MVADPGELGLAVPCHSRWSTQPSGVLERVMYAMGDSDDFEAVFRAEYPRLVRALGVAFGIGVAADAVQEAFIEADRRWRRIGRLEDPAGWVRRVAINKALTANRTRRRRARVLAGIRPESPEEIDSASRLDLAAAVAALPDRMRLTVTLHYLADLPVAEVANLLGVSVGTAKSNLHDARSRLRAALKGIRNE